MNMQVVSAPAAGLPVPAPVHLHDTDEPIIRLIKAYQDGCKAYNALPDEVTDGPNSGRAAEETYAPYLCRLSDRAPAVHTAQGAIAALTFALDEAGHELDSYNVGGVIRRTLEFLESAAGAALVHPDAELLQLAEQLRPLDREHDELDKKFDATSAEASRLLNDRTGLEFTRQDAFLFGAGIREEGCATIAPWAIKKLKPFDLDIVDPTCKQRALQFNRRLTELTAAYDAYWSTVETFDEISGRNTISARMDELYELRSPLMDKILETPARTVAGLAVKAALAKRQNPAWWREPRERQEFDTECAIALIDDVLAIQGDAQ